MVVVVVVVVVVLKIGGTDGTFDNEDERRLLRLVREANRLSTSAAYETQGTRGQRWFWTIPRPELDLWS